ncbi:glycosyltransferase family 39 protein [Rhodococcus sp. PvR099]|uniref:glycosyltransferase family 39 protein n=1 Tax=Rhodococcus sp. PvR099 TaxID=2806602 RepID=UPI001AE36E31|nr:glycosyltransferase family 39 protein [Rhodococcus sp. PvR099]MBP1160652.1 4-amino-4-deoxy-L-arabinose transferase-like glycosyltransferase [Rhodococcus sp. PvR099]
MTTTTAAPQIVTAHPDPAPPRFRWEPWLLAALLIGTAVAYIWGLGASGWANSFYSAAVQAGSVSWKAFFFGSSDAANSITVDKPPASLWMMALSVRAFGLSSWSILVPQALMGVATVALLWATVRRYFGAAAGLLAGLVLALTPVAVLMFRFNNPDALLVLLMVASVWALLRGVSDGRTRWLVLTGAFVGLGFLTKQLQVMLVVPPLALTYLLFGPPKLGRRVLQLFAALAAMVAAAGWWLLTVELWPADSRPWIGGSQDNSILELTLGYNGLGRLSGNERGSVTPGQGPGPGTEAAGMPPFVELPGGGPGGMWGSTGITRMFDLEQGGQIAWLIPAALILGMLGIVLCGRSARVDPRRAAFVLFGSWLVVTGLVFSFMAGIFHSYYTVAMAPQVGALVGAGAVLAWRRRADWWVRVVLAGTLAASAAWAWELLGRSSSFLPWLRWTVLVVGALAAVALLWPRLSGRVAAAAAVAGMLTGLAGPAAYAADTIGTPHGGALPTAGPSARGLPFDLGEYAGAGWMIVQDGKVMVGPPQTGAAPGTPGTGPAPGGPAGNPPGGRAGKRPGGPEQMSGGGPGGGLLNGSEPSADMTELLEQDADRYTWVAATVGSNSASGYQLATGDPVMPIGGFNGSDPSPSLAQFQQYVAEGRIHYFIGGGGMGPGDSGGSGAQISEWVAQTFAATTVDGATMYDLTAPRVQAGP